MTTSESDLAALEYAAKARIDAAKAEYDSALKVLTKIAALREKHIAEIAALRQQLGNGLPASNGVGKKPATGESKTDRVLKVLSPEYKKAAQLANECGLTREEVSHALSQNRIKRMIQRRGEPGNTEYRLKKTAGETTKLGTTDAILSVLRTHPAGLSKKTLTNEVEKLSPSNSETPRNAIQATISKMRNEGAIVIDASDVCTIARKEAAT
jgi:hypothetical protein